MEDSYGSADKEMSIIQDSMEYKMNALSQTWVGFWQKILQRDALKDVIDGLITLSEYVTNTANTFPTLATAATTALSTIMGFKGKSVLDLFGQKFYSDGAGGVLSTKDVELIQQYNLALKNSGNYAQAASDYLSKVSVNTSLLSRSAKDGTIQLKALSYTTGFLTKSMATLKLAMASFVQGAIIGLVTYGVTYLIKKVGEAHKTTKEKIEELQETMEKYGNSSKAIDDAIKRYQELNDKLQDVNLTQEEYNTYKNELIGIQDNLIETFGDEAAGIDLVTGKYQKELEILQGINKENANRLIADASKDIDVARNRVYGTEKGSNLNYVDAKTSDIPFFSRYMEFLMDDENSDIQNILATNGLTPISSVDDRGVVTLQITSSGENALESYHQIQDAIAELVLQYSGVESGQSDNDTANQTYKLLTGWIKDFNEVAYQESYDQLVDYVSSIVFVDDKYSPAYENYLDAISNFNEAYRKGESTDVAYENLMQAKSNFESITSGIQDIDLLYDDLTNKINQKALFDNEWANLNEDTLQQYQDEFSEFTDEQLKKMDRYSSDSPLANMMDDLDIAADKADLLINKINELGWTQNAYDVQSRKNFSDILTKQFEESDFIQTINSNLSQEYNGLVNEFQNKFSNIDINQSVFGNVDLNSRGKLVWTDELIRKYQNALSSWEIDDIAAGDISTVLGSAETFSIDDKYFDIAFTPLLQTEKGLELLDTDTVYNYLDSIIGEAADDGKWSFDEILDLDSKSNGGMGLIAAIGDDAIQISEAMHYLGNYGAIAMANNSLDVDNFINEVLNNLSDKDIQDIIDNNFDILGFLNNAKNDAYITNASDLTSALRDEIANSKIIDEVTNSVWYKYRDTVHKMMRLSSVGKLNEDTISSFDGFEEILEECGGEIDSLVEKIEELNRSSNDGAFDAINNINSLEGGAKSLNTVYQAKMHSEDGKGLVDAADLTGLYEEFGNFSVLDDFVSEMIKVGEITEETQLRFDEMATSLADAKFPLSDLTEANKEYAIAELEAYGYIKPAEAVEARLAKAEEIRTNALQALIDATSGAETKHRALFKLMNDYGINTTEDLANATEEEIQSLFDAAVAAGADTAALQQLLISKTKVAQTNYQTTQDVQELLAEAHAAGVDTYAYRLLTEAKYMAEDARQANMDQLRRDIENAINSFRIDVPIYSFGGFKDPDKNPGGGNGDGTSDQANETKETFDWIEVTIQRIEEALTRLNKTETNTFKNWTKRTKALNDEMTKTADKIDVLQLAYDGYMQSANEIGLPQEYVNKIQNGIIEIEEIIANASDESIERAENASGNGVNKITITEKEQLIEDIKQYQDLYNKAIAAQDQIEDCQISLSELAQTKLNNLITQFEEVGNVINGVYEQVSGLQANLEAQGRVSFNAFYLQELDLKQNELANAQNKREQALKQLAENVANGYVEPYSEAWYNEYQTIQDIDKEIIELNGDIIELNNNIRQQAWDNFDLGREKVSEVIEEVSFLAELLNSKKLTDGYKNTGLTDEGNAQMALNAINYNMHMAEASKYAEEIVKIDKDLAKDPYDINLINRRKELVNLQQESINNANSEREAMIQLARDGYDAVLETMQELIDKKKDLLNIEKDTYDYQKSLAEKNSKLASLYKQQAVYINDTSEEGKKRLQELNQNIREAEQDLKDTEYDRYISDQEKLMDNMYEDLSEFIDDMFEHTDILIQTLIDDVNSNSSTTQKVISDVSKEVGYSVSDLTNSVWKDSRLDVSTIKDGVIDGKNSVSNIENSVGKIVDMLIARSETESSGAINSTNSQYQAEQSAIGGDGSYGQDHIADPNTASPQSLANYVKGLNLSQEDKNTVLSLFANAGLNSDVASDLAIAALMTRTLPNQPEEGTDADWLINQYLPYLLNLGTGQSTATTTLNDYVNGLNLSDTEKNDLLTAYSAAGISGDTDSETALALTSNGSLKALNDDEWSNWLVDELLPYLLDKGKIGSFATGVQHLGDELAWTNEHGKGEIIRTSDGAILTPVGRGGTVFTNAMSDVLWNFASDPEKFLESLNVNMPKVSSANVTGNTTLTIGQINLPNVTKPEEFSDGLITALQNDNTLVKAIQSVTIDRLMGKNSKRINTF